jgi:NADH-quinone oxidoreductase subunit A
MNLLSYFISVVIVAFLLIFLALMFVKKHPTRKKLMSYECGFEPFTDARKPFYINFYNIGLIFLLFDVELMLLLPGVYSLAILTPEGLG